jgi:putative aminopeptidase FrvX
MKDLIKKLTQIVAPSGREEEVMKIIIDEIKDYVDDYEIDPLGSLIVHKKGNGKKILFDAHADEIGIMVTYIEDNGFLRFEILGGINPYTLLSRRIIFQNGTFGTIYYEAEKTEDLSKNLKNLSVDYLYVDIGAKSKEEAEKKVKVGDMASWEGEFVDFGDRVMAKSMDDRIACATMIEAIKSIDSPKNDLYFVFAVQEEVGLVGTRPAAYRVSPDMAVALDVTPAFDTPKGYKRIKVALGKGPAIKIQDKSLVANKEIVEKLVQAAEKNNIPYQYEVLPFGGTDGGGIQLTKGGIKTGVISIPCRYVHSPNEMIDMDDYKNTIELIKKFAEEV